MLTFWLAMEVIQGYFYLGIYLIKLTCKYMYTDRNDKKKSPRNGEEEALD